MDSSNPYQSPHADVSSACASSAEASSPLGRLSKLPIILVLIAIAFLPTPAWISLANSCLGFIDWWFVYFSSPVVARPVIHAVFSLPVVLYVAWHVATAAKCNSARCRWTLFLTFTVLAWLPVVMIHFALWSSSLRTHYSR